MISEIKGACNESVTTVAVAGISNAVAGSLGARRLRLLDGHLLVNVALLLTVLTLRAWHWCLPPGELHSPGHCIHSMHYEHKLKEGVCARSGRDDPRSKSIAFVHVGGEQARRGRAVPGWGQGQGVRVRSRVTFRVGAERVKGRRQATGLHLGQVGQGRLVGVCAPIDRVRREELTAGADEGGDVGPLGAGAGTSLHRQSSPRAPAPGGRQAQHSACACRGDLPRRPAGLSVRPTRPTRSRAARADPPRRAHRAPRSLRQPARPGSRRAAAGVGRRVKGCSCGSGRARRDLRDRCGRGHVSERP